MSSLHCKLGRDLIHMRGQVIAVSVVVLCGIASYVAMGTAYRSLVASEQAYYSRYSFGDVFAQLKRAPESTASQFNDIPGIASISTRVVREVLADVPGLREPATVRLISVPDASMPTINGLALLQGRYVEPRAVHEAIVSQAFAEANHLHPSDHLMAIINGRRQELQIVGIGLSPEYVYEIRPGDIFPDNRRFGVLWMNRSALEAAFDMKGAFNDVSLVLSPNANEPAVLSALDRILTRYGGLGAYGRKDQVSNHFVSDEIQQDRTTATIVPLIFLFVSAFLIDMVLSRLVSMQRDQIAVLKAFGYSNFSVGLHYLEFAVVAVAIGGIAGTGLGLWMAWKLTAIYMKFFRFPVLVFDVRAATIATAFAITAASAVFGAVIAVGRAVALPPAEAMRPESPPTFRRGLLERLHLQKALSFGARMIVRNLERRPYKALLSVLGIAFAVSILVTGRYFYDAVERIVQLQFGEVQRESVSVDFNEPRPARVRYQLAHLPGALRVEPFRAVAARIRYGHREKRVAVIGRSPGDELRRIVDRNDHSIPLPLDGVVLTSELAHILGVRPGQAVTIEMLEGRRPVRQVIVSGLADELIGLSAYMNANALNRIMGEQGSISGAYLLVDTKQIDALQETLKRNPTVTGVGAPLEALASFRKTFAESMGITTAWLTAFACVIAIGMVYNGARTSLSERARELASLRILGFTRSEITRLLLREQALLTTVALPIGCAIGIAIAYLWARSMGTELFRLPMTITRQTIIFATFVIGAAGVFSGFLVRRRLHRLDLVAVLKSRE